MRFALLIDSDNIAAKNSAFILDSAKKYGNLVYKRIYGDWEKTNSGWRIPATNNSILQIQQNSYIAGKNATDFSIVIDAMDILYTGNVDGFVLVTSDSDFTRLAIRLREAGKIVIGIGSVQTPLAFSSSCHEFIYINASNEEREEITESKLRNDIIQYVKDNDDGKLELAKINAFLNGRYGNIDYTLFGSNRLSAYIDNIPEIIRRGNYVMSLQKSKTPNSPKNQPSEKEITDIIVQYLKRKTNGQDDLSRVMAYITQTFGKVDFSRFGSKHFSKFIDRHRSLFVREKNVMFLAKSASVQTKPASSEQIADKSSAPQTAEAGTREKAVSEKNDKKEPVVKTVLKDKITKELFDSEVIKYAEDNAPNGGNLGQLNNMLLDKYGREYTAALGFPDFASALSSVSGTMVRKNFVFVVEGNNEPAESNNVKEKSNDTEVPKEHSENSAANAEKPAEIPEKPEKGADHAGRSEKNASKKQSAKKEQEKPKPEINAVKRDILGFAAQKDGGQLPMLGKLLNEKYGRGYLKELGFPTVKKLAASMNGLYVKDNVVHFEEEFLERTDKIEQLVYDFARSGGPHGIKALSTLIKKNVENFDFTDYGYTKISDFINAIDGVRVNGRYVEAIDET